MPAENEFWKLINQAVSHAKPVDAVRQIVLKCIADGLKRKEIETLFGNAALRFRAENREREEDILVDELDYISGWCSPRDHIPGLDYSDI